MARDRVRELAALPPQVRTTARLTSTGEVEWSLSDASEAVMALTSAGFHVLGIDLRSYEDGVSEVPWFDCSGLAARDAEGHALDALARAAGDEELRRFDWALVTWST